MKTYRGLIINIALLHRQIVQELQKRDVECISLSPETIQICWRNKEVFLSLSNLHRALQLEPHMVEPLIDEYLDRVLSKAKPQTNVYPRILRTETEKSLAHPWVQSFLGAHLEVALIEHAEGRMQYLSPLQLLQRQGGLKRAKKEAIDNIRELLPQIDEVRLYPSIWRICHPEVLTSSLLLCLDELLERHSCEVIQFAIPNRGTLYYSIGLLETVEPLIQQDFVQGAYPITPQIYQITLQQLQGFRSSWEGH